MALTPEQRMDKNGRLVTRHVRNGPTTSSSLGSIPAPSLPTSKAKPEKVPTAKTKQKLHAEVHSYYADDRLKKVCPNGVHHFTCSDAEAYDVMSVTDSSHTAIRLLGAGVRSKDEAVAFLHRNGLSDLQQDNSRVVAEAIRRGLPAIPTLLALQRFGLWAEDQPTYYDAVEAHTVRSLREASQTPERIPNKIFSDKISLSDVRTIGATRLAAAEKGLGNVVDQLEKIHTGDSPYGIETLQALIALGEKNGFIHNQIRDADFYGADFVLGLKDWYSARAMTHHLPSKTYNRQQIKELMQLNDDLRSLGKHLNTDGLCRVYGAGVSAKEVSDGLNSGLEIAEIIAIKEGVESSLASGWL